MPALPRGWLATHPDMPSGKEELLAYFRMGSGLVDAPLR